LTQLGQQMKLKRKMYLILMMLGTPLSVGSQTVHDINAWEERKAEALKHMPEVVESYANSIGCNVSFNPRNFARWQGSPGVQYIALVVLDEGCAGGSATWRSILLALREGANAKLLIHPGYSLPELTSPRFPQLIDSISATPHGVRFTGRVADADDPPNTPSDTLNGIIVWSGTEWTFR